MKTRPAGLDDQELIDAVGRSWDVRVDRLSYIPEGFGSYHWIAETAAGDDYFVTVDDLDHKPWLGVDRETVFTGLLAAFDTAHALSEDGHLGFVVAPVRSASGYTLHRLAPRYGVSVFPFVAGRSVRWGEAVDTEERTRVIDLLSELHMSTPPTRTRLASRPVELPGRAALDDALKGLDQVWSGGPLSEAARYELGAYHEGVAAGLEQFTRLSGQVAEAAAGPVVTHGEPHPGNFVRAGGRMFLVDWDTVALADPERDLWMLDDGTDDVLHRYTGATGRTVNPVAQSLYRLSWSLGDIAAYISVLRSEHELNEDSEKTLGGLAASLRTLSAGDDGRPPWAVAGAT